MNENKSLKVFEWNVKNLNKSPCKSYVADIILDNNDKQKPDIVVFTEYCKMANKDFEEKMSTKYKLITNEESRIMIAINKEINCVPGPARVIKQHSFLAKKIKLDDKIITLVGIRIEVVGRDCTEDEQERRKEQLVKIVDNLKNEKNVIVIGDFNNYKLHGDENDIKNYEKIYEKKDQKIYNLQIIKKLFAENNFEYINSTPNGDTYSFIHNANYKYDHVFVKGDLIIKSTEYDWDWKDNNKFDDSKGYHPDHALLKATVELCGKS